MYVRTIGVALMRWQAFDGALSRLWYGEQFGEVMLSRLGSKKYRDTWAVTLSNVGESFVQICPARINRHLLLRGFLSDIETEMRQRLHSYVTGAA